MILIFKIFFLLIFFSSKPIWASEGCSSENNLRVGLIKNDFIDYQYYLYYEIGNYAKENNLEFELGIVEKNIDEFDIIFGEFNQLKNLSIKKISLPDQIKRFYSNNGLEISRNILPLDLDTLIVLSNEIYSLKNLEELSNLYSPIKYTFGMNFNNNEDLSRLINFSNHQETLKLESNTVESTLSSFNKLYKNTNKNILDANFIELYNSYENKENLLPTIISRCQLLKCSFLQYSEFDQVLRELKVFESKPINIKTLFSITNGSISKAINFALNDGFNIFQEIANIISFNKKMARKKIWHLINKNNSSLEQKEYYLFIQELLLLVLSRIATLLARKENEYQTLEEKKINDIYNIYSNSYSVFSYLYLEITSDFNMGNQLNSDPDNIILEAFLKVEEALEKLKNQ